MVKFYNNFLLFTLLLLSISVAAQEVKENVKLSTDDVVELPVITKAIDRALFEGEPEEIKEKIDQRKKFIEKISHQLEQKLKDITLQIDNLKAQQEKDETGVIIDNVVNTDANKSIEELVTNKERLSEILNNLKDIHYKHVNLVHEIDNNEDTTVKRLEIKKPYSIFTVDRLNDFIETMINQETQLKIQVEQSSNRLKKLEDILKDTVVEYTIELEKNAENFDVYNLLRSIYLYQTDYAILTFKNERYTKQLDYAKKQIKKNTQLLPQVMLALQIDENDYKEITKKIEANKKAFDALQKEHTSLKAKFDKISFKAELDLDNLETKIKNTSNETEIENLLVQKQINLNKIKYSYFIKNLLNQKELALELERDALAFNLKWLKTFEERKKHPKEFKTAIKTFQSNLSQKENVIFENTQMLESLNRSTIELTALQKQLLNTTKSDNRKQKSLRLSLNKQLDKNLKTIQRLSLQLTENNHKITQDSHKQERVVNVLSQQLNKIEQIGKWFGDKYNSQMEKVKNVLYYPLTNFGDRPFTLAIILKVLLYLILGFMSLKFLRPRLTKFLTKRTKLNEGAANSIATLIYYLGGLLVILLALSASGFNLGQMMIVFGALGVGIGFGLQNIANNFVSGMILLIDRTLTVGDSITLSDGTHGKVSKLAMRYTVIRTNGGNDIIVPNSELIANRVTSMTFDDNYFRIEIPFGVSYNADPEQVKEITLEVANKVKHTINRESQKSAVLFKGLGDNSLDFVLRVWVFIYDRYRPYAIRSDYYYKLFKAFKEAGIEIPFPQRDFHIRSIDKKILDKFNNTKAD